MRKRSEDIFGGIRGTEQRKTLEILLTLSDQNKKPFNLANYYRKEDIMMKKRRA